MATATTPESKLLDPQSATEPDGLYEVVDGQVQEKPPMGTFENILATNLVSLLNPFVKSNRLGWAVMEPLFRLDPVTNLQRRPDLAFVSFDRWPRERRAPRDTPWDIIPDLAVEVISPTNMMEEVMRKVEEYFHAGVRQVWIIHPSVKKIHIYHNPKEIQVLGQGDILDGGQVVPGFQVGLDDLFGEG